MSAYTFGKPVAVPYQHSTRAKSRRSEYSQISLMRTICIVGGTFLAPASGLSHRNPVSGFVAGAAVTLGFDEGLQLHRTATIAALPIVRQLPGRHSDHDASQKAAHRPARRSSPGPLQAHPHCPPLRAFYHSRTLGGPGPRRGHGPGHPTTPWARPGGTRAPAPAMCCRSCRPSTRRRPIVCATP
jgi:hypothetical protein